MEFEEEERGDVDFFFDHGVVFVVGVVGVAKEARRGYFEFEEFVAVATHVPDARRVSKGIVRVGLLVANVEIFNHRAWRV